MDTIFARWLNDEDPKEEPDVVANALGAAFGEWFVERLGFQWMVITDQYGSEYAVRHKLEENTAFPRASVEKRIKSRETEFFDSIYLIVLQNLKAAEARAAHKSGELKEPTPQ